METFFIVEKNGQKARLAFDRISRRKCEKPPVKSRKNYFFLFYAKMNA